MASLPPCKTAAGRRLPTRVSQPSMFSLLSWPDAGALPGAPTVEATPRRPTAPAAHFRMKSCKVDREVPPMATIPAQGWTSTYDADFVPLEMEDCPCGTASRVPAKETVTAKRAVPRGKSRGVEEAFHQTKAVWETEYRSSYQDTAYMYGAGTSTAAEWVLVSELDEEEKKEAAKETSRFAAAIDEARAMEAAEGAAAEDAGETRGSGGAGRRGATKMATKKKASLVPRAAKLPPKRKPAKREERRDALQRANSDTQTARVLRKPIFHAYGRDAVEPDVGGVIYGNYMRSFHADPPYARSKAAMA